MNWRIRRPGEPWLPHRLPSTDVMVSVAAVPQDVAPELDASHGSHVQSSCTSRGRFLTTCRTDHGTWQPLCALRWVPLSCQGSQTQSTSLGGAVQSKQQTSDAERSLRARLQEDPSLPLFLLHFLLPSPTYTDSSNFPPLWK